MRKTIQIIGWILLIIILGGVAGVFFERIVMPRLASVESLNRFGIFRAVNEQVTVIENTKEVIVKEDFSVRETAQNVLPAVVSLIEYEKNTQQLNRSAIRTSEEIQKRIRTGIILTSDGVLMVAGGGFLSDLENETPDNSFFKVLLPNGQEFDAEFLTEDEYSEMAFFKIEATNLATPPLGNSDELETGEKIMIAGNANGENQVTFTRGVIREKDSTFTLLNSELSSTEKLEGAILTDAEITAGNAGGAVIDFAGTLVGIADKIEKNGEEVGFILPINRIKGAINEILSKKEIARPYLGAYYLSINREIALLSNLPVNEGALIHSFSGQQGLAVVRNSPAEFAGLRLGDIIRSVDEETVTLNNPLSLIIAKKKPKEEIGLKVLRKGEEIELTATLR